ncbi:MAG: pth [Bacteroidetes bacterium]|jgi:PTH1 family peptidyl-tRNA hydrolase|nr:pth [Bacteroidota bacterium]
MPPADPMLVLCLGNPGPRYLATRHNVGFMVADELARRAGIGFSPGRGEYWSAPIEVGGEPLILVKPVTYMNNSGTAALQAAAALGAPAGRMLVVIDDVALPLGSLRLRLSGSDGGHNGLGSVIASLGTDGIARLRCGIRPDTPPPAEDLAGFVLSPFAQGERDVVASMIVRAADAVSEAATSGLQRAMARFNA